LETVWVEICFSRLPMFVYPSIQRKILFAKPYTDLRLLRGQIYLKLVFVVLKNIDKIFCAVKIAFCKEYSHT